MQRIADNNQGHKRRAHAVGLRVPRGVGLQTIVGRRCGAGQRPGDVGHEAGHVIALQNQIAEHFGHHDLAGDLAAGVASHAIGQHREPEIPPAREIGDHRIFLLFAGFLPTILMFLKKFPPLGAILDKPWIKQTLNKVAPANLPV